MKTRQLCPRALILTLLMSAVILSLGCFDDPFVEEYDWEFPTDVDFPPEEEECVVDYTSDTFVPGVQFLINNGDSHLSYTIPRGGIFTTASNQVEILIIADDAALAPNASFASGIDIFEVSQEGAKSTSLWHNAEIAWLDSDGTPVLMYNDSANDPCPFVRKSMRLLIARNNPSLGNTVKVGLRAVDYEGNYQEWGPEWCVDEYGEEYFCDRRVTIIFIDENDM